MRDKKRIDSVKYCIHKKKFGKEQETIKKVGQALYRSDATKESAEQALQLIRIIYEV